MKKFKTWFYLAAAARVNQVLRPFGLILMAEFEGDPPARPFMVERVFVARRGEIGLWP